jgi:CarD-like protein
VTSSSTVGVGRVVAREKRPVHGSTREVVVVELADDLMVSLPIERAGEQLRSSARRISDGCRRFFATSES